MDWRDLVFLHWPVPAADLQTLLPRGLEIESCDGTAWLGIVPFRMARTRLRCLPGMPGTVEFPELNVRTYVRHGDTQGVWFFSLDATSPLVVAAARRTFGLNYLHAKMQIEQRGQLLTCRSERLDHRGPPAHLTVRWCSGGDSRPAVPGTLQHFLVERYCLFSTRDGVLLRGDIAHAPWQLQPASVELGECDMTRLLGLELPDCAPYALCAEPVRAAAWRARPAGTR